METSKGNDMNENTITEQVVAVHPTKLRHGDRIQFQTATESGDSGWTVVSSRKGAKTDMGTQTWIVEKTDGTTTREFEILGKSLVMVIR